MALLWIGTFITGLSTHSIGGARLATVTGVCRRL